MEEKKAAIEIQKTYRGAKARKYVAGMRAELESQVGAALAIQKAFRRMKTRKCPQMLPAEDPREFASSRSCSLPRRPGPSY